MGDTFLDTLQHANGWPSWASKRYNFFGCNVHFHTYVLRFIHHGVVHRVGLAYSQNHPLYRRSSHQKREDPPHGHDRPQHDFSHGQDRLQRGQRLRNADANFQDHPSGKKAQDSRARGHRHDAIRRPRVQVLVHRGRLSQARAHRRQESRGRFVRLGRSRQIQRE